MPHRHSPAAKAHQSFPATPEFPAQQRAKPAKHKFVGTPQLRLSSSHPLLRFRSEHDGPIGLEPADLMRSGAASSGAYGSDSSSRVACLSCMRPSSTSASMAHVVGSRTATPIEFGVLLDPKHATYTFPPWAAQETGTVRFCSSAVRDCLSVDREGSYSAMKFPGTDAANAEFDLSSSGAVVVRTSATEPLAAPVSHAHMVCTLAAAPTTATAPATRGCLFFLGGR